METAIGQAAGYTSFDGAGRMGVVISDTVDQDGQRKVRILSATVARSIGGTCFLAFKSEYLDATLPLDRVTVYQDQDLPQDWQEALASWRDRESYHPGPCTRFLTPTAT